LHLLLIGDGYLGQAIAAAFRARAWMVTACARGNPGNETATRACDVGNPTSVAALADAIPPPDFLVHCAASGHGGPEAYRHVYLQGCRNLARAFPGIPLLFTSSTSVYAQCDGSEVSEDSPADPGRETGQILLETEQAVLAAGGIVARLAGIYGPGRSVILARFLAGQAVIEDDGRRFLNQIHRDDAASAILHLAESAIAGAIDRPALYNVADSRPLTQLECHRRLAELCGLPVPPFGPRDTTRKRGWTHKRVSNKKLLATGWQPRFPCFLDALETLRPTPGGNQSGRS
jgi:nucleoside-diphosphate-sugar epimerase